MIKSLLNKLFPPVEFDANRRRVIKSVAALAALTVAPGILLDDTQAETVLEGFNRLAKEGVIDEQTFYIDETIVINIPNLIISNCRFIATKPLDCMVHITENAHHCIIKDCHIVGCGNGAAISYELVSDGSDRVDIFREVIDSAIYQNKPIETLSNLHRLRS